MDFAVVYLLRRFVSRIADFFRHWYFDGSRAIARRFMATMMSVSPSLFIVVRGILYAAIALVFAFIYLVWLAIPAVILFYAAKNI
jgi:hypothetical protein